MPNPIPGQPLSGSTTQSGPNPTLGADLAGLFWEPIEQADDYHHAQLGTGLLQIPGNAFHNAAAWGQGLATMGSMVGARTLETFSGQPLIRKDDGENVLNFGKAILNDYKTGYVDPIVNRDPRALYSRFAQRPLDVASDALMLAPGVKAVGKLPGVARAVEAGQLGASAASQRLFGHLEQIASKSETLGPAARAWQEKRFRDSIVKPAAKAAYEKAMADFAALDDAARGITPEERINLRGKLEGWDPDVLANGQEHGMSAEAQHYRDVAGAMNIDNENKLEAFEHVTRDQVWREKWKPLVKAWFKAVYGVTLDVDLAKLSPDKLAKLIHAVATYFQRKGIHPINVPRMTPKNVKNILDDPSSIPAWAVYQRMKQVGKATVGGEGASKAPFEYERTALETGEQYSDDVVSLHKARRLQIHQATELFTRMLDAVMDASQDIQHLSAEQIAALDKDPNFARFRPREFFGTMMDKAPPTAFDTTQTVHRIFAEECFIPAPLAKVLTSPTKPWKAGNLEKGLQAIANFSRRYILGFNMLWPEKQFGQNLLMLGLFQWKGPKDALVSAASYTLMADPRVRAMIPEIVKGEAFAADASKQYLGRHIEGVANFTFMRAQFYDRLSRATAAVYYALKLSELPELVGPIRGMLTTGEAINRMEMVFMNTARMQEVNQKVITVLGDYSRLAAKNRQTLRSVLLWWMWYEHIVRYAFALPWDAPLKTSLLGAIARTHTQLREDAEGIPEGLKQAGAVPLYGMENDQEMPLYTMGGSLNPFTTLTELIEFVRQPVEGAESSTVVGAMNPLFTLGVALMGINPSTGHEFRRPDYVSIGGRQYDYKELQQGLLNEKHPRPLMAGGLEYAMRTIFPQPTRLAERLFAKVTTGGEPSQFTSVLSGEANPRVVYDSGGEPLAAGSVMDILKEAMLGQRAFPIDENATITNESINRLRMRKALRAARHQIDTTNE